jgi:CBS domain-containing protein
MDTSLVIPLRARPPALIEQSVLKDEAHLQATDSAFCALTDFRKENPITVDPQRSIDDALADMVRLGVHALLVTQEEIECDALRVLGLITAYDIERERPHRRPGAMDFQVPQETRVVDVMTPWNELSLINYESLRTLTTLDLYDMFQGTGLTHLLVIDVHGDDFAVARGLASRANLADRLRRGGSHCRPMSVKVDASRRPIPLESRDRAHSHAVV